MPVAPDRGPGCVVCAVCYGPYTGGDGVVVCFAWESGLAAGGYDSEEEERDLHHQGMYMNGGRNHHFGPPPTQEG